mmetsp:Transcript_51221/g.165976  ORF Transcript_51221/g.165976 Transcript_51221/m.165976 type:complete len:81 (-) Transcript_51221:16-258(-)
MPRLPSGRSALRSDFVEVVMVAPQVCPRFAQCECYEKSAEPAGNAVGTDARVFVRARAHMRVRGAYKARLCMCRGSHHTG